MLRSLSLVALALCACNAGRWAGTTNVQVAVNRSGQGAIYKGLAISSAGDRLYATDFANGHVDFCGNGSQGGSRRGCAQAERAWTAPTARSTSSGELKMLAERRA